MDGVRRRKTVARWATAVVVGVIVAASSDLLAFRKLRSNVASFRYRDVTAMHELDVIEKALEEHRKTSGRLPGDLAEAIRRAANPEADRVDF